MKRIVKSRLGGDIKFLLTVVFLCAGLFACKEQERFEIGYNDSEPPSSPEYVDYIPLYGGARIFFEIPEDRDLLSIDATYLNPQGKTVWFSVSYFQDSIDVYGFGDTIEYNVSLYAVDRAGNRSDTVSVPVKPLKPAVSRVVDSLKVKGGFSAFYVDWQNELAQNINVYVDFSYTQKGEYKEQSLIYTSADSTMRWFIRDLDLAEDEPLSVKVRIEDMYGNITPDTNRWEIIMPKDEKIPKDKWRLLENDAFSTCDSMGGVPMAFLTAHEGYARYIIDDIIDDGRNGNFTHTGNRGRTGKGGLNVPYNIIIDLGDYYEISRIVTHQRYLDGATFDANNIRQSYYKGENVGRYSMYTWKEVDTIPDEVRITGGIEVITKGGVWDSTTTHKIIAPVGKAPTDMEYKLAGDAGDMAFLYPDDPQFSKPTRYFRYEALGGFSNNFTSTGCNCMSEITLYGRKANMSNNQNSKK